VHDVLVWSKVPFLYRDELVAGDRFAGEHHAQAHEVKRLGDEPIVFEFAVDGAKIEVAAKPEPRSLVTLPLTTGSLTR